MQCDECRRRPATVHLTKIINGHKTEVRLCEQCAREKGEFAFFTVPSFSFQNLLAGLLEQEPGQGMPMALPQRGSKKCGNCGVSYSDFSQSGFLGCSECYQEFEKPLEPLLRKIQGNTRHTGKVPGRTGGAVKVRKEIESLRQELQRLIMKEEYENAAEVRDRIKGLEKKLDEA